METPFCWHTAPSCPGSGLMADQQLVCARLDVHIATPRHPTAANRNMGLSMMGFSKPEGTETDNRASYTSQPPRTAMSVVARIHRQRSYAEAKHR